MADFWKVNSYGYPNPLSDENGRQTFEIFESFFNYSSYAELKAYWSSSASPRAITPHSVESRKATFEEFGLLYVAARSDEIVITPGGIQYHDAAVAGNEREMVWTGLNLLLRYPLQGPPRRSRGGSYAEADLLLYWFLFAALCDLDGYIWWPELERVLSTVFRQSDGPDAVELIRQLRAGERALEEFPLPVAKTEGAFYNSLNQVVNHAGMNDLILERATELGPYGDARLRKHWIRSDKRELVDLALGASGAADGSGDCTEPAPLVARMPRPPLDPQDEESYFAYLGAPVPALAETALAATAGIPSAPYGAGTVSVLSQGVHYVLAAGEPQGSVSALCRLSRNQRVVFSHDLAWTYLVEDKVRIEAGLIRLHVRRGKPISNPTPLDPYIVVSES